MKWLDILFPLIALIYLLFFNWHTSVFGVITALFVTLVAAMAVANLALRITRRHQRKKQQK
ncbi:hypothetical protein [Geomicrobium sp. JCM 19038]|uniref:hypothetical protein n=1 Tax=Geomicrobium sp. JCM 19038 TaxID=1460635 RepID=UPI00045F40CA|nr:hypothetical protein [Geomicrobium sp. JCM 19038]GAK09930.1 hypothetical protein JCM19038_3805 [Geomicrobium sp. JCM 19038]